MTGDTFYHEGNRSLQDRFESRRIADRLAQIARTAFSDDDKAFIENAIYFFLATVDAEGRPDCSFKGGPAGFARVTGPSELAFPDYDGNGMFRSLGNLAVNPEVGLLFIAMHGTPRRLRVNGTARIDRDDLLTGRTVGAQMTVRSRRASSSPTVRATSRRCSSASRRPSRPSRAAIRSNLPGRASTPSRTTSIRVSRHGKADRRTRRSSNAMNLVAAERASKPPACILGGRHRIALSYHRLGGIGSRDQALASQKRANCFANLLRLSNQKMSTRVVDD